MRNVLSSRCAIRDTGDAATDRIAGLSHLTAYYAGMTRIIDRSLEVLARMHSFERLEFWACQGITEKGIAHLAALPKLRELTIEGSPGVSSDVEALFPAKVNLSLCSSASSAIELFLPFSFTSHSLNKINNIQ